MMIKMVKIYLTEKEVKANDAKLSQRDKIDKQISKAGDY